MLKYILLINYYEKAESCYFLANKLIKDNNPKEALDSINKSEEYIKISKQKYEKIKDKTIILTSYKKSIEDFEIKIEVKKLVIQFNNGINFSNINIQELADKYSKCYGIELDDYKELVKIAKIKVEQFQEEDYFENKLNNYYDNFKRNGNLYNINECLIYIINTYPAEDMKKGASYYNNLSEIKSVNINKMYSIILKLIGEYQKSLNNLYNNNNDDNFDELIYNKILIFLNKIKTILDN